MDASPAHVILLAKEVNDICSKTECGVLSACTLTAHVLGSIGVYGRQWYLLHVRCQTSHCSKLIADTFLVPAAGACCSNIHCHRAAGAITELIAYRWNLGHLGNSISLWLGIRPADVFLYVFLPPLLFFDSANLDYFVLKKVHNGRVIATVLSCQDMQNVH